MTTKSLKAFVVEDEGDNQKISRRHAGEVRAIPSQPKGLATSTRHPQAWTSRPESDLAILDLNRSG